jgi:hypothetical protein
LCFAFALNALPLALVVGRNLLALSGLDLLCFQLQTLLLGFFRGFGKKTSLFGLDGRSAFTFQ